MRNISAPAAIPQKGFPEVEGLESYVSFIAKAGGEKRFPRKIVIDVSNGSSGPVFQRLAEVLGMDAVMLNAEPGRHVSEPRSESPEGRSPMCRPRRSGETRRRIRRDPGRRRRQDPLRGRNRPGDRELLPLLPGVRGAARAAARARQSCTISSLPVSFPRGSRSWGESDRLEGGVYIPLRPDGGGARSCSGPRPRVTCTSR